jgi:hypothetical protein
MSKFYRFFSVIALLAFSATSSVWAQSTTDGAIGGVVRDPAGAVVPNATVTARNQETNQERTATTDSEGRFRVVQLQPGNYTVQISATGFSEFSQQGVVVEVGLVTPLEISLGVGGIGGETITVTGEAPVINTSQQDFSTNVNQVSINNLPINGRRASDFVRLTPGVVPDGAFGLNSFRGISGLLNNNTVDGGDNNQAFFSEERGRTRIPYVISQSAVREFQVNTSNYSAEYGRAAGGVVNTVTRSGTNEFHGDLFYYIRDNRLGARNPFATRAVLQPDGTVQVVPLKPEDQRHQFGGTIGGPIVRDRLFFFFSYDEQRRRFPAVAATSSATFLNPITVTNPAAAGRSCTTSTGAQNPALTPGEILFCRNLTQAQVNSGLGFISGLTGEVPRRRDQRIFLPKIDWVINSSNTFSVVYNRLRAEAPAGVQSQAVVFNGISSFGDDFVDVDTLNARLASTISPRIINEARFQYSRDLETQFAQEPSDVEAALLARPGVVANSNGFLPQISTGTGGITFGQPNFLNRAAYPDERRFQFADSVTMNIGNQTIKFGGDFNHVRDRLNNLFLGGGAYSYSTLVDFLSDFAEPTGTPNTPTSATRVRRFNQFQQAFGQEEFEFTTNDYNFFFQDDIRIDSQLTLSLGLRYEYQQLPDPQIPNSLFAQTSEFPSDWNNFGPRIGFAYDVFGDGRTSIRGGFGVYYGRIINSTISNAITNTGTATAQRTFTFFNNTAGAPTFPSVLPTAPTLTTAAPAIVVFQPNFQNPQIYQGDFIIEREIARNTVVSASYLISVGKHLPTFIDINLPAPITNPTPFTVLGGPLNGQTFTLPIFATPGGVRPNTNFNVITEIQSEVSSQYDALVLQFNRRFTNGLQFQTNYTLARATDSGQISQTFTTSNASLNPFDRTLDEGTSNFDIRHRFVASAVYSPDTLFGLGESRVGRAIFGGFTIAPVVTISSGRPFSAGISGNATAPAGTVRIGSGILGAGGPNRAPFLERNAFRLPMTAVVDLRVSRRFNLGETRSLEILAEAFNLFNRTNVTNVGTTAYNIVGNTLVFQGVGGTLANPTFGIPNEAGNTIFTERQIQLAVRFQF